MFVFSSICSSAVWFVVRLVYDLVWREHRRTHPRRRFWTITLVAAALVTVSFFGIFSYLFSTYAGTFAAIVVAPAYVGLTVVIHRLLAAFGEDAWELEDHRERGADQHAADRAAGDDRNERAGERAAEPEQEHAAHVEVESATGRPTGIEAGDGDERGDGCQ
jgi:hypothetical protein